MLNAHFLCKDYGGRPSDDLLGDSFEFSLNTFVRRVGVAYENEQYEERKRKSEASRRTRRR